MKIVKFLLIPETDPWKIIFYMCGGCGRAIRLSNVEEHAKTTHQADGVDLYEVADDANVGR